VSSTNREEPECLYSRDIWGRLAEEGIAVTGVERTLLTEDESRALDEELGRDGRVIPELAQLIRSVRERGAAELPHSD